MPVLKPRDVAALLSKLGFKEVRRRGSHRQEYNGIVYFSAHDEDAGIGLRYLWRTDGTDRGTFRVTDRCNSMWFGFGPPTVMSDILYFTCQTDTTGKELWSTDGTDMGSTMIADIVTGLGWAGPKGFPRGGV